MNPKPFASLNHLTVPVMRAIATTPCWLTASAVRRGPWRRAFVRAGLSCVTKRRKDPRAISPGLQSTVFSRSLRTKKTKPEIRAVKYVTGSPFVKGVIFLASAQRLEPGRLPTDVEYPPPDSPPEETPQLKDTGPPPRPAWRVPARPTVPPARPRGRPPSPGTDWWSVAPVPAPA